MISDIPPGLILIIGAFFAPLIPSGWLRKGYLLFLPIIGFISLLSLDHGSFGEVSLFGYELIHVRIDALSLVFGINYAYFNLQHRSHSCHPFIGCCCCNAVEVFWRFLLLATRNVEMYVGFLCWCVQRFFLEHIINPKLKELTNVACVKNCGTKLEESRNP